MRQDLEQIHHVLFVMISDSVGRQSPAHQGFLPTRPSIIKVLTDG
jgi:hypothetical protein